MRIKICTIEDFFLVPPAWEEENSKSQLRGISHEAFFNPWDTQGLNGRHLDLVNSKDNYKVHLVTAF